MNTHLFISFQIFHVVFPHFFGLIFDMLVPPTRNTSWLRQKITHWKIFISPCDHLVPNSDREVAIFTQVDRCFQRLEAQLAARVVRLALDRKHVRDEDFAMEGKPHKELAFRLSVCGPNLGGLKSREGSMELHRVGGRQRIRAICSQVLSDFFAKL